MRIRINQFKVVEIHRLKERGFFKNLLGIAQIEYHFDVFIKVVDGDRIKLMDLQPRIDYLELPNRIRVQVWHVEIGNGIVRAKTATWIKEDLRKYRPLDIFLVYSRRHGHISGNY